MQTQRGLVNAIQTGALGDSSGAICKIACNIDPLRGCFASNSDPL